VVGTVAGMDVEAGPPPEELPGEAGTANPARMYDYLLGGAANFAVDRDAVRRALAANPWFRAQAHANRAFLRRVVHHLAVAGVRQFLDLGSGVPTVGHVHQIAQRVAPDARVVYVDNEPVAASFSRHLLDGVAGTAVLQEDLHDADRVLHHPRLRALLDLREPVAVLMFAVLHFILDDSQVADLVAAYRDGTVAGSYLAISHACADDNPAMRAMAVEYQRTSQPFCNRTHGEVAELFAGYRLVEPGVVYLSAWRPDQSEESEPVPPAGVGGVGRRD
jgi:S-adenosyl methyltransferase